MTAPATETPDDPGAAPPEPARPRRRRGRIAVLLGITVIAVVGAVLVVAGLSGAGSVRSAPPIAAADARPPVTVAAPVAPSSGPSSGTARPVLPPSPPSEIDIPAIGVRSVVNASGLNPDGTLAVPAPGPRYDDPSWYTGSAAPGTVGPAVVLGHIDSAANGPSVFYELSRLQPLDEFTVTRADGVRLVYKVNSVKSYPKDAFPTEAVYGPTTRPEIRLITCGGTFDDSARSYRDNTVVYANQISP